MLFISLDDGFGLGVKTWIRAAALWEAPSSIKGRDVEQLFAFEIWLALIGVSCITGWLVGDWNGSERMRRLIGVDQRLGHFDWEPLKKPGKYSDTVPKTHKNKTKSSVAVKSQQVNDALARERNKTILSNPVRQSDGKRAKASLELEFTALDATDSRDQPERKLLDRMPPLSELHAQAEAIRRSDRVWDNLETGIDFGQIDPHSAKLLANYKASIEALQDLGCRKSRGQFELDLPRFSDAAPVSPFFNDAGRQSENSQKRTTRFKDQHDNTLSCVD